MPKTNRQGSTYAGYSGVVEHADGSVSELDDAPVENEPERTEAAEPERENAEASAARQSSAAPKGSARKAGK